MTSSSQADLLFAVALVAAQIEDIAARIVERGGASSGDGQLVQAHASALQRVVEAAAGAANGWRAPLEGTPDAAFNERFAVDLARIIGDGLPARPGAGNANVAIFHASRRLEGRSV